MWWWLHHLLVVALLQPLVSQSGAWSRMPTELGAVGSSSARLETRIKESMALASLKVIETTWRGEGKVNPQTVCLVDQQR